MCRKEELLTPDASGSCGTGCAYDNALVWTSTARGRCLQGWSHVPGEDTCVRVFSTQADWSTARQLCLDLGGDLACPTNQGQQDFLSQLTTQSAWIGANDRASEGSWKTAGGDVLAYTAGWCSGEPNNQNNEDCAVLYPTTGCWNDLQCSTSLSAYMCEIPTAVGSAATDVCMPCAAGTYSNVSGASECVCCVAGKYASATGATACVECPPRSSSLDCSSFCCCEQGWFADDNCRQCQL